MTPAPAGSSPRVVVLADDLIWATRLADGVRRAGGDPVPVRAADALPAALAGASGCVVDLTSRAYDGVEALRLAAAARLPVVAVGQHDDAGLRREARAAGADRVFAYRTLFEHGDRELAAWLARLDAGQGARPEEEDA